MTFGEYIAAELKKDPSRKLYITGHSLGGAAATLAAARLSDLGVAPGQLEVITFGAPAVGNDSFARHYEHNFQLTRVTMAGDPVNKVLQSLTGGFVQFGQRVEWRSKLSERFPHGMAVYLDEAYRHYVDAGREDEGRGLDVAIAVVDGDDEGGIVAGLVLGDGVGRLLLDRGVGIDDVDGLGFIILIHKYSFSTSMGV